MSARSQPNNLLFGPVPLHIPFKQPDATWARHIMFNGIYYSPPARLTRVLEVPTQPHAYYTTDCFVLPFPWALTAGCYQDNT